MLSFVTAILTDDTPSAAVKSTQVLESFATAAGVYLAGIFFILISTIFFAASQQLWGGYWEAEATGEKHREESRHDVRAAWCE